MQARHRREYRVRLVEGAAGHLVTDAQVAQVFQEVAGAETIHGMNHLRVSGEVRSSVENLRNVVTGESKEISTMYPRMVKDALDDTPPELVADLMESGICMAGGASQLMGLPQRMAEEVNIRVWLADDAATCVARGAGRVLEDYNNLRRLLAGLERGSTQH